MNLGGYQLLAQRGAGSDGILYRAQRLSDAAPVEVCVLDPAHAGPEQWARLCKRLRLSALLDHPAARAVLDLALEHQPPFIILQRLDDRCPLQQVRSRLPLPLAEAVAVARRLASVLAAAH